MTGQQLATLSLQDYRTLVDQKPSYVDLQGNDNVAPSGLTALTNLSAAQQGMGAANAGLAQYSIPRGMFESFVNTCQRWRLEQGAQLKLLGYPEYDFLGSQLLMGLMPARTQDVKDRIGYVLAISLGLGTIFNEAIAPEVDWLSKVHPKLGESPLQHMLRGRMVHLIAVVALVSAERNL
jgi:hypothetical protein